MTENKKQHPRNPYPTVDAIVEYEKDGKKGIILIERKNKPLGYALPGGFVDYGLSLEENVIKEVKEETGLKFVPEKTNHPFCTRSSPDRDPRAHMISVVYVGKGTGVIKPDPKEDAKAAHFIPYDSLKIVLELLPFAFDHKDILYEYYTERL